MFNSMNTLLDYDIYIFIYVYNQRNFLKNANNKSLQKHTRIYYMMLMKLVTILDPLA